MLQYSSVAAPPTDDSSPPQECDNGDPMVTFDTEDFVFISCGPPGTCLEAPSGPLGDEIQNIQFGAAEGCWIYPEPECVGVPTLVDLNLQAQERPKLRLYSFDCFEKVPLLSSTTGTVGSPAHYPDNPSYNPSSPPYDPSDAPYDSSNPPTNPPTSPPSSPPPPQDCNDPLITFFSDDGLQPYDGCGPPNTCIEVPKDVQGRELSSVELVSGIGCLLYQQSECGGIPEVVGNNGQAPNLHA
jgi:hypothetical protein